MGLFNLFKKTDEKKPDGTFQYSDEKGKLQEKWMPPEKLKGLLEKGNAKRVYKVLIKGPWSGVKEDWWELGKETVKKFGDEEDTVRVMCVYEKGEPKYNCVAKKMWEKWEEVGQIVSNPNLSPEQRVAEVKKLLDD